MNKIIYYIILSTYFINYNNALGETINEKTIDSVKRQTIVSKPVKYGIRVEKQSFTIIPTSIVGTDKNISRTVIDMGTYSKTFTYVHNQDTKLASDTYRPSEWRWNNSPNDVFYRFTLENPMLLQASCFDGLVNKGNVYLVKEDLESNALIPIPAIEEDNYLEAFLLQGTYYCIVEGPVNAEGECYNGSLFTIITGTIKRKEIDLGVLTNSSQIVTEDTRTTANTYGGIQNDVFYKFELVNASDISSSIAGSEIDNINIYILDSNEKLIHTSQNSRLSPFNLSEGIYYLVAEGVNEDGIISINISTSSVLKINIGSYTKPFRYSHTQDTRLAPDAYRPPNWKWNNSPNDVFYKLTCDIPMTVKVLSIFEGVKDSNVYIVKEDESTSSITPMETHNNENEHVVIGVLQKGTYYIITEGPVNSNGTMSNGKISTLIQGIPYKTEIDLGVITGNYSKTVTYDTHNAVNAHGSIYNDVFYRFELKNYAELSASLTASEVNYVNMYLIESNENPVQTSQDSQLSINKLHAGIYYLIVEGIEENGIITANIEITPLSKLVYNIGAYSENFSYKHTEDTQNSPDGYRPLFWPWPSSPNDVFYRFTLNTPMYILATSSSKQTDSEVYIVEEDTITGELTPIKPTNIIPNLQTFLLPKGTYNAISEGVIDKSGNISNGEIITNIIGSPYRMEINLGIYNGGSLQFGDDTRRASNVYGNEFRNDIYYKFYLKRQMNLTMYLKNSNISEVNMYLLDGSENLLSHSDSGQMKTDQMPKGYYYLVVEGKNEDGLLSLNLEPGIPKSVIDLGIISTGRNFSYTFDTSNSGNWFGLNTGEVFYKIQLTRQMDISIRNQSTGDTEDSMTSIYLVDELENIMNSSEDGKIGLSVKGLPPGTYYVISEGKTHDMNILTEIFTTYQDIDSSNDHNNYIQTRTYMDKSGANYRINIDYFDGFGRPSGSTLVGASPLGKDIVTRQDYDNFGRKSREWLPKVSSSSNGRYITPTEFEGLSPDIYNNDPNPFSRTVYENSPFNRVIEQFGPGQQWQLNDHGTKNSYLTNFSGGDTLNCIYFTAICIGDTLIQVNRVKDYDSHQLYVTRVENEDGHASFEFKDKIGRVLLTRQVKLSGTLKELFDTYYIYDDFNNLIAVLPPELSYTLSSGESSWTSSSSVSLRDYAYLYQYDSCNRCIAKKIPGCEWIFYIYDKADRLIFSQDGNQRKDKQWSFSIPDIFGRIALTGVCYNPLEYSNAPLASHLIKATRNNTTDFNKGYTLSGISLVDPQIFSVNYYDDYDFIGKNDIPDSTDLRVSYDEEYKHEGYGEQYVKSAKGLLTGTLIAQLGDSSQQDYMYSVVYYDYKGRIIQTKSSSHLVNVTDREYVAYNFTGQPIKRKQIHFVDTTKAHTEVYTYTYDHVGRLLTTSHKLDDGATVNLVVNAYDELGRLSTNRRNGKPDLKTDYTYNIRSWIKSITGALFSQTIYYNERRASDTNIPCFSGNISGMDWYVICDKSRGYDFCYDALSRLTSATYFESDIKNDKFNTFYDYDKHGNIRSLVRYGNTGTTGTGIVDNLSLRYKGNQVVHVDDAGEVVSLSMSMDFKQGSNEDIQYYYDGNGNLVKDLNKGISDIKYNLLNLPDQITFTSLNNPINRYVYSAIGKKLSVTHGASSKRTDYVSNMIYENGTIKRILVDGGYIEDGVYYFYLKDYQGNNRVVAKSDGTVVQTTHYYPFGMTYAESTYTNKQPYKYNDKELDMENGLNIYDYGTRLLSTAIPRFTTVDPKAEKYYSVSPYVYCGNNPVMLIDVNGEEWGIVLNANGTMTVTLAVNLKTASDLNLTASQINEIKTAISTQLNSTFQEVSGGRISASMSFDGGKDPNRLTPSITLTGGDEMGLGLTGFDGNAVLNVHNASDMTEFGETSVHELFHTLNLQDVADTPYISDTRMTKTSHGYHSTSTTANNIHKNIMNYGSTKIDGRSYKEIYKSRSGMNKITKGQLHFLIKSILKQTNGYGMMPQRKRGESDNEYKQRYKEYYENYWLYPENM